MKTKLFALTAAFALSATGAIAADVIYQPPEIAPPAVYTPFDWTGFYLGAHLGGLANLGDISDPLGGSLFGNPNRATGGFAGAQIEAMLSYDVTERLSLGIGARYWAMWTTDASMTRSFDASGPVTPLRQHLKIETERAGIFGQALYRFD